MTAPLSTPMIGALKDWDADVHPDTLRAAALERELQAVYASSSWRLTRPLRQAGTLALTLRRRLRALLLADGLPRRLALALAPHHPALARQAAALPLTAALTRAAVVNRRNVLGPRFETLLNMPSTTPDGAARPPA